MGITHDKHPDRETFWLDDPGFSFTIDWSTGIVCVPEGREITDEQLKAMQWETGTYISRDDLIRETHDTTA